jgi:DNA gyrase/topoisomerase IV subunit A
MGDEKITFRVDSDTKRRVGGSHTNLSGVMRDLAQRYAATGDTAEAALLVEREQVEEDVRELKQEISDLEARLSKKQRDLERIDTRIQQRRESITEEAREYAEKAVESPRPLDDMLAPDNPALRTYAADAGKDVDEFVYEVRRVIEE